MLHYYKIFFAILGCEKNLYLIIMQFVEGHDIIFLEGSPGCVLSKLLSATSPEKCPEVISFKGSNSCWHLFVISYTKEVCYWKGCKIVFLLYNNKIPFKCWCSYKSVLTRLL